MRRTLSILFGLILVLALAVVPIQMALGVTGTTVCVTNLQPSWTATGGGGVWAAYYGPPSYPGVSPGSTAVYNGREAAPIYAGVNIDPPDLIYEDEGLLGFKPGDVPIST